MTQQLLPFQYSEASSSGLTSLAGLPIYFDLAQVAGLSDYVRRHLQIRPANAALRG